MRILLKSSVGPTCSLVYIQTEISETTTRVLCCSEEMEWIEVRTLLDQFYCHFVLIQILIYIDFMSNGIVV